MGSFEQQEKPVEGPKVPSVNDKLNFTSIIEDSKASPKQERQDKKQTHEPPLAHKEQSESAALKTLLSPNTYSIENDHRTADQVAKSHQEAINKPITHEEFLKAQAILQKPGLTDDATRGAISEKLGLPANAKDAEIRQKIADAEMVNRLMKDFDREMKFLNEQPRTLNMDHVFDKKVGAYLQQTPVDSGWSKHDRERNAKDEALGQILVPGISNTKDNRTWADIKKSDEAPMSAEQLKAARGVLEKPALSDVATQQAIAETLGLPKNAAAADIREWLRTSELTRRLFKDLERPSLDLNELKFRN